MSSALIRRMAADDLRTALDWAAAEGWNPGVEDAFCFATVDPDGLFVRVVDGKPVGSITVVNYDEQFAFLGLYIVHSAFRGQDHGRALWRTGMEYAGGRLVGLDGVVEQQANYQRSGFIYAHRNLRFAGVVQGADTADVVPLDRTHLDAVERLDATVFPANRRAFLDAWLSAAPHFALGVFEGDALTGFGVLRPCRSGAKIGPLVARDLPMAEALFDGLVARWGGGEVFLDVPAPNSAATALAKARGMTPMFETARMYTGPAPAIALDWLFGITTFELG